MAVFFDTYIEITPPATTGWQEVDLTSQGVPTNAVVIIRTANDAPNARTGARKVGSGDNRILQQLYNQAPVYVGCNSNSKIELYKSHANAHYWLCGYLTSTEAGWITTGTNVTPPGTGWLDIDLSSYVPVGSQFAILEIHSTSTNGMNFRRKGSGDTRQPIATEQHFWTIVGVDASRICQIWKEFNFGASVYIVGYVLTGTPKDTGYDVSCTSTGIYQNRDLSGDSPPAGTGAAIIEVQVGEAAGTFDLRKDGISEIHYHSGNYFNGAYIVPLESNIFEGKVSSLNIDYWVLGYIPALAGGSGSVDVTLPASTITAYAPYVIETLPLLQIGAGGYWTNWVMTHLPMLEINAFADVITHVMLADLPVFTIQATGIAGALGNVDVTLPSLIISATTPALSIVNVTLPMLTIEATAIVGKVGEAELTLPMLTMVGIGDVSKVGSAILTLPPIGITAEGITGVVGNVQMTLPAITGYGAGIIKLDIEGNALLVLPSLKLTASGLIIPAATFDVFVMNTRNTALSKYTSYGYESFCKFGNLYLGASSSGIYLLEGTKDDAVNIDAKVATGKLKMGVDKLKRVIDMFLGMKANGTYQLKVTADDGTEYTYDLTDTQNKFHPSRVKFGKGIKGKYYTLKFYNTAGADFEIDVMEADVETLSRKA